MSGPEHFLTRWSRLKRQRGEPEDPDERRPPGDAVVAPASQDAASTADAAAPAQPEFDIASLPPIDSITAATDIRPFLAPGVPAALTRAALRRMWSADPSIRDFIEIAENQWDFANPDSIPGFSTFQPGEDIGRYVAELRGEAEELLEKIAGGPPAEAPAPAPTPLSVRTSDPANEPADRSRTSAAEDEHADRSALPAAGADIVQRSEDDAAAPREPGGVTRHAARLPRRTGGGALPQ